MNELNDRKVLTWDDLYKTAAQEPDSLVKLVGSDEII